MVQAGIVLLVLGAIPWAIAFVAAPFGSGAVAGAALDAAKVLSPLLLTSGTILEIVGPAVRRQRAVG